MYSVIWTKALKSLRKCWGKLSNCCFRQKIILYFIITLGYTDFIIGNLAVNWNTNRILLFESIYLEELLKQLEDKSNGTRTEKGPELI